VAAYKREVAFILAVQTPECVSVHDAFRWLVFVLHVTSCLTAANPEEHPAPTPADRKCRHRSRDRACAVPAVRAPATRRACAPAIPAAAAARRVPAPVAVSRAADCPAAPLVAARSDFPA